MKRLGFVSLVIALVFVSSATPVSALTIGELQAQIQSLLARVSELAAQLKVLQQQEQRIGVASPSADSVMPGPAHRVCASLARNLSQGVSGDDVASLQEFLRDEGYFSTEATGYFGTITVEAVTKWQAAEGVQAIGTFGPVSRERLKKWCFTPGPVTTQRFEAAPTYGPAPLTVTFSTWLSGFRINTVSYYLDYGDGVQERAMDCYAPADACLSPGTNTHTYTQNGVFTARLVERIDPCAGQIACRAAIQEKTVAQTVIRVGSDDDACTKEYRPVCGAQPIVCITTPCNPIPTTYENKCLMERDNATFLYEGACRTASSDPANDPLCKSWYDGCNECSRSSVGGPAMCTLRACIQQQPAYCKAYFTDPANNKPPVISRFSGPTTLAVNASGSWGVSASDPEYGKLTYDIWWGDESATDIFGTNLPSADSVSQTTTFTHAYAHAGAYTVTISVRDNAGATAQATATVEVKDSGITACTLQYDPICGRPPGCANTCPPGAYCTMECRLHNPVTYSNKCFLEAADAEFLYRGACNAQ